mmetsp:Transcript_6918/g.13911  ORF Transcript_6918/g.13911 Transcript_6918/m.13911 type:complete len:319 (-) Transcript_6918:2661-3617(-)
MNLLLSSLTILSSAPCRACWKLALSLRSSSWSVIRSSWRRSRTRSCSIVRRACCITFSSSSVLAISSCCWSTIDFSYSLLLLSLEISSSLFSLTSDSSRYLLLSSSTMLILSAACCVRQLRASRISCSMSATSCCFSISACFSISSISSAFLFASSSARCRSLLSLSISASFASLSAADLTKFSLICCCVLSPSFMLAIFSLLALSSSAASLLSSSSTLSLSMSSLSSRSILSSFAFSSLLSSLSLSSSLLAVWRALMRDEAWFSRFSRASSSMRCFSTYSLFWLMRFISSSILFVSAALRFSELFIAFLAASSMCSI